MVRTSDGQTLIVNADEANENARRRNWPIIYDRSCHFLQRELNDLLLVWRDAAGPSPVPRRNDLTARLLRPFLSRIALYERVGADDGARRYRVRLMGTSVVQMIGELTGRYLDEAFPEEFVPR